MRFKQIILSGLAVLLTINIFGQISPPGLGKAKTAGWFALGIRQDLDTIDGKGWQSMTYFGLGRKSDIDSRNLYRNPALMVVNQEFYHQINSKIQYSLATSYRRGNEYLDEIPYDQQSSKIQQEFRLYGRFSYIFKNERFKFVPTFRQEFRKFYTADFKPDPENFQFRTRLRFQLTSYLSKNKMHKVIASAENLFAISKENYPNRWTKFNYKESRFSIYYSFVPTAIPVIFNVGYMRDVVGFRSVYTVDYLAFDIIIENPFKLFHFRKEFNRGNLE